MKTVKDYKWKRLSLLMEPNEGAIVNVSVGFKNDPNARHIL